MSPRRVRSPTVREGIAGVVSEEALPYDRASDTFPQSSLTKKTSYV